MPMITEATPIAFSDPLPDAVDVVIIGAGIIGTATAYFLAKQNLKVLLCEKGRVAGEQSSRNWGWIRQQGRDWAELPIMMESNRIWRGLAEKTGETDLTFTMSGCVYLAENHKEMAKYEGWYELARQHQLDTRLLTKAEAAAMATGISGTWVGGMVTPSDGRGEPFVAVPAFARAASNSGVTVIENCAVRTLDTHANRVTAVMTEKGSVKTNAVVLAGGAWSTYFASNIGLDLAQLTVRSTVGRTHALDAAEIPNISAPGFHIRRRNDGGFSVATGDVAEHYVSPRSFKHLRKFFPLLRVSARDVRLKFGPPAQYPGSWTSKSRWAAHEKSPFEDMRVLNPPASALVARHLQERLSQRAPWISKVGFAETWAGMIDVTPDAVPYICEAPDIKGLFIGTGMSGHGFGIGPGVGRVLADLVQGHDVGHDIERFRFNRFSDGSAIVPGPY